MTDYITLKRAAKYAKRSFQAIYQAIQRGTLEGKKLGGHWYTKEEWIDEYLNDKRNIEKIKVCGKKVYDKLQGNYTVSQTAKFLGVNNQHVYSLIRQGKIKSSNVGWYHVISSSEICKMQEEILQKSA